MAFPIPVAESFPPDEFQISSNTHVGNSGGSGDLESSVPEEEHLEIDKEISPDSTMLQDLPSLKPLVPTQKTNPVHGKAAAVHLMEPNWDF